MNELDPLVVSGVQLMLVGMGTVFVFLTLLVFAVRLMSKVLMNFVSSEPGGAQTKTAKAVPAAHVAAIAGALEAHRRHRDQR